MNYILDRLNSEKKSNLPMVISLITGFPSFVLYTLEVIVIVRHWRKFESAFWHLFFVRACIHIIDFLDSVIFHRQGKIPILDHSLAEQIPSALLGIGYFLWLYCYESQNLISIFIVLTRLTAIQFPVEHQTFWRRFLPFCILVTFIIPLFDTWENLGRKYRYEYDDRNVYFDNTSYGLYYDEVYYEKNYKILGYESNYKVLNAYYTADNFVFMRSSVILLVVATSLNIVTIYLYSTKQGNTTMSEEQRNMEKRLLIFTVLNFLCQLLVVLWWIIQTSCYGRHYLCNLLNNNQHWIKDIDALHSPAWLILWSSKMLRELVCKQIGIGNFWNRQHSLQQTSSQTQHQPMNNLQIINPNNNMISPTTAWK